ncbi:hypothetical protein FNV43_RR14580 [Rhamnella rubrinervis]|uniref:Uncharacterized protein n=1 Tax=Rhamnella rubrinervis TaxID=2594499 RepID=A0A8K0H3E8_9ROSA|nr:hypothetical protein FNV43_RR14577 [Rhamnella rubrinervis]KAF3444887.1 hypothetical protein FNV43_RR14580 [Rhamnella rubrinervis]
METSVASGLSLTVVLVMMVVIVPSPNNQRRRSASAEILPKKSNSSTSPAVACDSHNKEECLIGDHDLEMEFQMESETSERLLLSFPRPTIRSLNPQDAVSCDRRRFDPSCIGKPFHGPKKDTCSVYKRVCPSGG